jgi:hypothetical protein
MVSSAESLRQRLPAQDLQRLSLVSAQPKKLHDWLTSLPMVNVGESARQVYVTIQEVNRLSVEENQRFLLLESIRPTVHYLCQALAKHYLNQSVALPDKATKVATLAQAMQNHLATGYKLVVLNTLRKLGPRRDPEQLKLISQAIHRALSDLSGTLVRSSQLYLHTPSRLWLELHGLYLIAAELQLTDAKTKESYPHYLEQTSIEDVYVRALLLATCKPNKLRQQEIAQVYELSELWAPLVNLRKLSAGDELFVFDLLRDAPPTYRSLGRAGEAGEFRAIDPQELVSRLQSLLQDPQLGHPKARGEASLTGPLVQHLIQSWSELTERSFQRISHDGQLEICLGLTATHYFLAGGVDFESLRQGGREKFLVANEENPFNRPSYQRNKEDERGQVDVWSSAFGTAPNRTASGDFQFQFNDQRDEVRAAAAAPVAPEPTRDAYDRFHCQIVNISPGGYCIEWLGTVPGTVKAGELLGLRESGHHDWSLGVIRWVRQIPGHGAQLGLEVLAPKATPCGARVIKKTGDSTEFMRTLLLPELKALGRPATLITPNLTFRAGYKIVLVLGQEEEKAQLMTLISTTQSFSQFEFQLMRKVQEAGAQEEIKPKAVVRDDEDDFDTIWSSL